MNNMRERPRAIGCSALNIVCRAGVWLRKIELFAVVDIYQSELNWMGDEGKLGGRKSTNFQTSTLEF